MIPSYTLVVGVDEQHLQELALTWPTWKKHKADTVLSVPMIVFYDKTQLTDRHVRLVVDHPNMITYPWPIYDVDYGGDPNERLLTPQRHKMVTGFVYTAAKRVTTPYWLKLDTDTVAMGDPEWIDEEWFKDDPAIVSHAWSFTRPASLIYDLEEWSANIPALKDIPPLELKIDPESDKAIRPRIISWCAFFEMEFTKLCTELATTYCGLGRTPVPSQDTFMWFLAEKLGLPIVRTRMKKRGWDHWLTFNTIKEKCREAML